MQGFRPMLASRYEGWGKGLAPIDWRPCAYSQPKLDGVRCIASRDGLVSREGTPIHAPHIVAALAPFFAADPGLVLDGEIYHHALANNFDALQRLVLEGKTGKLEFHVFDMPSHKGTFGKRIRALAALPLAAPVHRVPTKACRDAAELDDAYATYIEYGYEGQMVRLDTAYASGARSRGLQKRKPFADAEFRIVSIQQGTGAMAGHASAITCALPDGRTFGVTVKADRQRAASLYAERSRWIGRACTVRFNGRHSNGVPRFGVAVAFHSSARI